jgi:hypothetical protein
MGNACGFADPALCNSLNERFDFGRDGFYGTAGPDTIYASDWVVKADGSRIGPYADSADCGTGRDTIYINRLSFPAVAGRDDFIRNCERIIIDNPPQQSAPTTTTQNSGGGEIVAHSKTANLEQR